MQTEYYDLHSHFLPGMDDGAADVKTAEAILASSFSQGAAGMAATSHYYNFESIRSFIERRQESFEQLKEALKREHPEWAESIVLGAEAAYHPALAHDDDLELLCLGKSRYLLLEMPFRPWSSQVLRDVRMIRQERGLIPVIAHLERYADYVGEAAVDSILEEDVLIQVNAGELLSFGSRRRVIRMIKHGIADVLGSDAHNMSSRPQTMAAGIERLKKAGLSGELERILENNKTIFLAAANGSVS